LQRGDSVREPIAVWLAMIDDRDARARIMIIRPAKPAASRGHDLILLA